MNVCLLYAEKDHMVRESYHDWNGITRDLGLATIFEAASREVVFKGGKVMYVSGEDAFLAETVKKVMRVPLHTKEEILFRQAILKDCAENRNMVETLLKITGELLEQWDKLGRKSKQGSSMDDVAKLLMDIKVMRLLVNGLCDVKSTLSDYAEHLKSDGLLSLYHRLEEAFTGDMEININQILENMSFFTDVSMDEVGKNVFKARRPQIVMNVTLGDGLKFDEFKLSEFATQVKNFVNPYGIVAKIQGFTNKVGKEGVDLEADATLIDQASQLERQTVGYVVSCCMSYLSEFNQFFDQLKFQLGFYRASMNLMDHMTRYGLKWCYPTPGDREDLSFRDLKEVVMSMEQDVEVIGNTCNEYGKMLMIVTGANQGGKSTFLRSIGIAQVLMQSGMTVAAESFCSGIFPGFFTHFTRREDSAMNSGRLDEELGRMDQIIKHLQPSSLLLLNESFASTTEKEGSEIVYDIIKALNEQGVKILTVTHLLSFAQKVYDESKSGDDTAIEFLSAERLENGTRTYHMVKHEPELTSFGLDLYRDIIGE